MGAGLCGLNGLNQDVSRKIWLRDLIWPWNRIPPTVWYKQSWLVLQKLSKANSESTKPVLQTRQLSFFLAIKDSYILTYQCLQDRGTPVFTKNYNIITVSKIDPTSVPIPHRCLCGRRCCIHVAHDIGVLSIKLQNNTVTPRKRMLHQ